VGPSRSDLSDAPPGRTGSYQELDEFGIRTYEELTRGRGEVRGTLWKAVESVLTALGFDVSVELSRVESGWVRLTAVDCV
jgi:hypothetical protein